MILKLLKKIINVFMLTIRKRRQNYKKYGERKSIVRMKERNDEMIQKIQFFSLQSNADHHLMKFGEWGKLQY